MDTSTEIINSLRSEFIQEANSAPKLFKDLAKVEQYIAESYKTRSFIELIQNADDAQSTVFGVHSFNQGLVVANNGRTFTLEDVEALCRSGASHKYRGGNTIGYRGIGFKSVLNLAKRICVFSSDFAFYFDKTATKKLFPDIPDVPLIRIPHLFPKNNNKLLEAIAELKRNHKYETLFVFLDINQRIAEEEISEFDKSSLLFLNNIKQVHFDLKSVKRIINIEKSFSDNRHLIKIYDANQTDEWEMLHSKNDPRDMIALKKADGSIVPALPDESLIHSFTPTLEFSGAYIKINGDYSTDPSRKNIDMDEFSQRSFNNVISMIVDTVVEIIDGKIVRHGFFTPFVNISGGSKFRSLLLKTISADLKGKILNLNGKKTNFLTIRLRPEWLNYEDYEQLCHSDLTYLNKELVTVYPELPLFLEQIGVKKLYLEEILKNDNSVRLSNTGAGQIVVKMINQYRYDLTTERITQIKNLKIFPINDKFVRSQDIGSMDKLNKTFLNYVLNNANRHDIKPFFTKLGIPIEPHIMSDKIENGKEIARTVSGGTKTQFEESKHRSFFKTIPDLKKWRSAEKNALEYLKAMDGVLNVTDVTNANMGYDLEVLLNSGKKLYIEVKSTTSFSEPIRLTNNEYPSAHNYGSSYYLAVVINEEPFQIRLIVDPINTLSFQKQIERWSWFCDSYRDNLKEVEDLFLSKES